MPPFPDLLLGRGSGGVPDADGGPVTDQAQRNQTTDAKPTGTELGPGQDRSARSPEVVLRRPTAGDLPGLLAVHGNPKVYELDPQETHTDLEHTRRWIAPILEHWDRHGFGYWTILVPHPWWPEGTSPADEGDRGVAGMGGVQIFTWNAHIGEDAPPHAGETVLNIYSRFAPQLQGRGLGGLVITEALRIAAEHRPELDVVVRTRPANTAMLHVARRAGFVDDGLDPDDPGMVVLRRSATTMSNAEHGSSTIV